MNFKHLYDAAPCQNLLEDDEGGGEDGATEAATRPGGGEGGGGGYTVSLVTFFWLLFLARCSLSLSSFSLSLSFSPGQAGRGQGESPRAAGCLLEGAADGERGRTVYNIVMIQ